MLRLTWASNLGSLAHAFPVGSKPYHEWENTRRSETKDAAGHTHKSHRLGGYGYRMTAELDMALEPLREAHTLVYEICDKLFAIEDMHRIARAQFHKGLTSKDGFVVGSNTEVEEDEYNPLLDLSEGEFPYPENGSRMFDIARRWHTQLKKRGVDDMYQYPVLIAAPALDDWNRPSTFFTLDTYTMTLSDADGRHQIRINKLGAKESDEMQWVTRVWQNVVYDTGMDLRFVDRRQL